MMNDLTHVAVAKGYLLLYLLLYYKADFADADVLRIQIVPLLMSSPHEQHHRGYTRRRIRGRKWFTVRLAGSF